MGAPKPKQYFIKILRCFNVENRREKRSQIRRTAVTTETGSHGDKTKAHIQRPHFRQWCFRTRSQKSTLHSWHFLSNSQGWLQLMGSATQQLFFPILFQDHQNVNALSASVHYRPPARCRRLQLQTTPTSTCFTRCIMLSLNTFQPPSRLSVTLHPPNAPIQPWCPFQFPCSYPSV